MKLHWQRAARMASRTSGRPKAVVRIDKLNPSGAEVPHVVFAGDVSLNIDGEWKHGDRRLKPNEEKWLARVGWVIPLRAQR